MLSDLKGVVGVCRVLWGGHLALSVVPEHACPISADWLIDHSSTICHPSTQHPPRSGFYFWATCFYCLHFTFTDIFCLSFISGCVFVQTLTRKLFSTAKYRLYKFTRMFVMPTLFYNRVQAKCKTAVIGSWRDLFWPLTWYESQQELEDLIKIIVE